MKRFINIGLFLFLALSLALPTTPAYAAITEVTNAQKLSLPADTEVGTVVKVTDIALLVSGAGHEIVNKTYTRSGTDGGKNRYISDGADNGSVLWTDNGDGFRWYIGGDNGYYYYSDEDVEEPWLVEEWSVDVSGESPAPSVAQESVYQSLAAPSEEVTAVFVSGAGTAEANGIYTERGEENGRPYYVLLGAGNSPDASSVAWSGTEWILRLSDGERETQSHSDVEYPWLADSDSHEDAVIKLDFNGVDFSAPSARGFGSMNEEEDAQSIVRFSDGNDLSESAYTTNGQYDNLFFIGTADTPTRTQVIQKLVDLGGGAVVDNGDGTINVTVTPDYFYPYSLSDQDSGIVGIVIQAGQAEAAWPTFTQVTQGELDAGVTVSGAGSEDYNGIAIVTSSNAGRPLYVFPAFPDSFLQSVGTTWRMSLDGGESRYDSESEDGLHFPWLANPYELGPDDPGDSPAPTVSRNDVASEANWVQADEPEEEVVAVEPEEEPSGGSSGSSRKVVRKATETSVPGTPDAATGAPAGGQDNDATLVQIASTLSFNPRDLETNTEGEDVHLLQRFLNARGFAVNAPGQPGSTGYETDFFGFLTRAALARFQAASGISPAAGYFGPITRAYVATLAI